jgi:beta-barrel assembly-enhancing protease
VISRQSRRASAVLWGSSRLLSRPRAACGAFACLLGLVCAICALAQRTQLRPGFNLFTPGQDIGIGRENAKAVEKQLPMLNDPRVDDYLNDLGHRLDKHVPAGTPDYPFQYKCVNDMAVNAFALPGGFIFVDRGLIEMADNEAELAGVMAHETAHVVLRHGTNQASKRELATAPLSILNGMIGDDSTGAALTQLGLGLGVNSLLLKNSRTDESQADILGTQIAYDSGYDPRGLAQFFEKLQSETKNQPIEFFSDHPNPARRVDRVMEEVDKLGGPPPHYVKDTRQFQDIKAYVHSLPPPPKPKHETPQG